jgi:hypothetical protein
MTPSEIEPATFQLVVQCLNQLRYTPSKLGNNTFSHTMLMGQGSVSGYQKH